MIKIKQHQDTRVSVSINRAFALVHVRFEDTQGRTVAIEFDMESSFLLQAFDDWPKIQSAFNRPSLWQTLLRRLGIAKRG